MKELARRLKEVDLHLTVVSGGVRRKVKRNPVQGSFNTEWDNARGVECSECKQETLRVISGMCPHCMGEKAGEQAKKEGEVAEKKYYIEALKRGDISLDQMREGRLGTR